MTPRINVRIFAKPQPYIDTLAAMQDYTQRRKEEDADELWLMSHEPVYTLGQASDPMHLTGTPEHPVVKSDRGGQITYHGPGQLVGYCLIDLRRQSYSIHGLVDRLEQSLIVYLATQGIKAASNPNARGVYVDQKKIASIGLRVKKHCSYHGFGLNVDMDLKPFASINPCGLKGVRMTKITDYLQTSFEACQNALLPHLINHLWRKGHDFEIYDHYQEDK
jgi:lipoyl(octanoyl) transferase